MSIGKKLRSDLFLQFLWPILLIGGVLLGGVGLVIDQRMDSVVRRVAESSAHNIYESFLLGAEQFPEPENRLRLIQSLSQSLEVEQIYLISLPSETVSESSGRQFRGRSLSDITLPPALVGLLKERQSSLQDAIFIADDGHYFHVGKVVLLDDTGVGFQSFLLITQLSDSNITRQVTETRNLILLLLGGGFFCILLLVYLSWYRYLVVPLRNATNTIAQGEGHERLIEHNLNNQLGELFDAYNHAQAQIAENESLLRQSIDKEVAASRAKSEFLANMSHELRTPLNSIIGFTNRMLKGAEKGKTEINIDALQTVKRNGEYLLQLINDVLDLSKISAGKMKLQLGLCDLERIIADCVDSVRDLARTKGLTIHLPEQYPCRSIEADPLRMQQIVMNLVSNAVKYTRAGSVHIEVREDNYPGWICIDVIDTGQGIREEDQDQLFRRFEQFDEHRQAKVGQGTGLGLSLVFEFVLLHGGRVSFDSEYGVGSRFSVHMPVSQSGSYSI